MTAEEARTDLERLSVEFFEVQNTADPLSATLLGVGGYDALLPDLSREGSHRDAARFSGIEQRLAAIDRNLLDEAGQVNHAVLGRLAWGARSDLEHGLWEANVSGEGYASPQSMIFMCVPAAVVSDAAASQSYLTRLGSLGGLFDAIAERYGEATSEGRLPTAAGVRQAIEQLAGHLALPISEDTLARPIVSGAIDAEALAVEAQAIVAKSVRPAMERLLARLRDDLLPVARGDNEVGIRFVPGGEEGYRAAVRRHTTTELTPEEIHQIGLDCIAELQLEWADLGEKVLGTRDVPSILGRLREDRSLRFSDSAAIVTMVDDALRRAEQARDEWFPAYSIAECVIEEINPIEAGSAALAHYRPPAADGSRPGAHCVLTTNPGERFTYEYEALAFHESTPGHHLQIASAQTLVDLPTYRRFLDAQVCGYVEGWGLYCERLADEMGLYSSDVARLGMLSFDSLRACRLVVDTGMHHLGWSRQKAAKYMWDHTATTVGNISNEVVRYIGWPGQALAYMIGRREIRRLRALGEERLGSRFDIRAFHGTVLGSGAVPLDVLDQLVTRWIDAASA
ncbi:MAG: uncharacterized protein JWO62_266 [Acidimicrobiaceae bacterium]|nr:uncharacterized protein [Acidimicrobiaceae bacterium]